jgi:hypothetical protein
MLWFRIVEEPAAAVPKMKDSARYAKIVEWSDEDQCFVGSCGAYSIAAATATTKRGFFRNSARLWTK